MNTEEIIELTENIKGKIIILYDYTNDKCRSFGEVREIIKGEKEFAGDVVFTNCLTFFCIDKLIKYGYDVVIRRKDGKSIKLSYLFENKHDGSGKKLYTQKHIRKANNAYRLFVAGALEFETLM